MDPEDVKRFIELRRQAIKLAKEERAFMKEQEKLKEIIKNLEINSEIAKGFYSEIEISEIIKP